MQLNTLLATLAGFTLASAKVLTVIDPCPQVTTSHKLSTVTAQHQVISTCAPTTACYFRKCSSIYPAVATTWVSTIIPCDYDDKKHSSTLVTKVTQDVTCSKSGGALTKVTSVPVTINNKIFTKTITIEVTVKKEWYAQYENLGPLAMPGYPGSGLCKDCVAEDGSISQIFHVKECRSNGKTSECLRYDEKRISFAPVTVITKAACPVRTSVPSAGTYTFKFPQTIPARTVTLKKQVVIYTQTVWDAYVTKVCGGPTRLDFTTTVTKTLTVRPPPATSAVTTSPRPKGWDDWVAPKPTSTSTATRKTNISSTGSFTKTWSTSTSSLSTSSTTASSSIGPISGSTTTTGSETGSTSTSSLSTSSTTASFTIGPIPGSTTTTGSETESTSSSTSSFSLSSVQSDTTTSTGVSTSSTLTTTTSSLTSLDPPSSSSSTSTTDASSTSSSTITTTSSTSTILPLPAQTCFQPSLSSPNQAQVTAAVNQWVQDISTVNTFLESILAGPPPALTPDQIEQAARNIYITAFDEPCQLFTLVSAISNGGLTSEASVCAFNDLANSPVPVFPTFVLGSLADVISDPRMANLLAKAELINHRRCCNVLRDVDVLFTTIGEQYSGLLSTAPRPSTCQDVVCDDLNNPPAATCSALPFTPISPTSTTSTVSSTTELPTTTTTTTTVNPETTTTSPLPTTTATNPETTTTSPLPTTTSANPETTTTSPLSTTTSAIPDPTA